MNSEVELEELEEIRSMLQSPGWKLFIERIVTPVLTETNISLKRVTPENQSMAPVYAAELRLWDRLMANMGNFIEERK